VCTLRWILLSIAIVLSINTIATADVTIAWDYTQNVGTPATSFNVQRCQIQPTVTSCTNMANLSGGVGIPIATLTFNDTTASANINYCYQVIATDGTLLSPLSNRVCTTTPQIRLTNSWRTRHFFMMR